MVWFDWFVWFVFGASPQAVRAEIQKKEIDNLVYFINVLANDQPKYIFSGLGCPLSISARFGHLGCRPRFRHGRRRGDRLLIAKHLSKIRFEAVLNLGEVNLAAQQPLH